MNREIKIIDNRNDLMILIPRTGHWGILVLTGSWCLMWIYALYLISQSGIPFDSGLVFLTVSFSVVWLFVFKTFLWHVRGTEKITLDKDYLRIAKAGTFLTSARRYELDLIECFGYAETNDIPWWSRLYGFAGGQISFDYDDRPEYFGQTVNRKEAREIVSHLNERLRVRTQQSI